MRWIVNSNQMRLADENTSTVFGLDSMILMERAALAVAERIMERFTKKDPILIMGGSGGNGGDGVAIGRILHVRGFCVTICLAKEVDLCSKSLQKQVEIAKKYQVPFLSFQELLNTKQHFVVMVDGLLGNGVNREVAGIYQEMIQWMNKRDSYTYALDLPSGINADNGAVLGVAVKANETIAFGFEKMGTCLYPGKSYAGKVMVAEIGITKESFLGAMPKTYALEKEDLSHLIHRPEDGNKGTFGKVGIIAGSFGMAGAAIFSARAALRMGAGMVKIITHASNREIIQSQFPEAMLGLFGDTNPDDRKCEKTDHRKIVCDELLAPYKRLLLEVLGWSDALVIGPGLSTNEEAKNLMDAFCQLLKARSEESTNEKMIWKCKYLIIDADAINLISQDREKMELLFHYKKQRIIFTPHLMELSRLTGFSVPRLKQEFYQCMESFCKGKDAVFVCKDATTLIIDDHKTYLNLSGSNALATAGSGDCLTGILAAVLGQVSHVNEHLFAEKMRADFLGAEEKNRCDFVGKCKNSTIMEECENYLISAACYFHGYLGERLSAAFLKDSAIASDLLKEIPKALLDTQLYV